MNQRFLLFGMGGRGDSHVALPCNNLHTHEITSRRFVLFCRSTQTKRREKTGNATARPVHFRTGATNENSSGTVVQLLPVLAKRIANEATTIPNYILSGWYLPI